MKILITQRELTGRGGSELFTIEVALALHERGHDVRVYTPRGGKGMAQLKSRGVRVSESLADSKWEPDVIHGQHHLQAVTALTRYPLAPMIYHIHGSFPWVEFPPIHGRILKYNVMCEAMLEGIETNFNIPKERVGVVSNFVDLKRFSKIRTVAEEPSRALLFGNNDFSSLAAC